LALAGGQNARVTKIRDSIAGTDALAVAHGAELFAGHERVASVKVQVRRRARAGDEATLVPRRTEAAA
jgi:hypothetical protein